MEVVSDANGSSSYLEPQQTSQHVESHEALVPHQSADASVQGSSASSMIPSANMEKPGPSQVNSGQPTEDVTGALNSNTNTAVGTQKDECSDNSDDGADNTNTSEFSDISDLSQESWQPNNGPMSWVQDQMRQGKSPRKILEDLIPSGTNIPDDLDSLMLWKIIINIVSEPPKRKKLEHVNTLDDVVGLLKTCKKIIVLTGAGVSVSCGIPDFRSRDGVYARLAKDFPNLPDPQSMFDINFFRNDPRPFFKFAKEIYPGQFQPSLCHHFIKLIESKGSLLRNYTQNIDTLEQEAGIHNVVQCHGSFATATCAVCGFKVNSDAIKEDITNQVIPHCQKCSPPQREKAVMKPDIVFFGESLPEEFHNQIALDKEECDLLIVIGSSLKVRPVALIPSALPDHVPQILINRERLSYLTFDVELLGNCDDIVGDLCRRLGQGWEQLAAPGDPLTQVPLSDLPTPPGSPSMSETPSATDLCCGQSEHQSASMLSDKPTESGASSLLADGSKHGTNDTSTTSAVGCAQSNLTSPTDALDNKLSNGLSTSSNSAPHGHVNDISSTLADGCMSQSVVDSGSHANTVAADGDPGAHGKHILREACGSSTDPSRKRAFAEIGNTTDVDDGLESEVQAKQARLSSQTCGGGESGGCCPGGSLVEEDEEDNMDSLENLRRMYQPKARISLATRLSDTQVLFLPPSRYVFKGAEVFEGEDSDEDSDDESDDGHHHHHMGGGCCGGGDAHGPDVGSGGGCCGEIPDHGMMMGGGCCGEEGEVHAMVGSCCGGGGGDHGDDHEDHGHSHGGGAGGCCGGEEDSHSMPPLHADAAGVSNRLSNTVNGVIDPCQVSVIDQSDSYVEISACPSGDGDSGSGTACKSSHPKLPGAGLSGDSEGVSVDSSLHQVTTSRLTNDEENHPAVSL